MNDTIIEVQDAGSVAECDSMVSVIENAAKLIGGVTDVVVTRHDGTNATIRIVR